MMIIVHELTAVLTPKQVAMKKLRRILLSFIGKRRKEEIQVRL